MAGPFRPSPRLPAQVRTALIGLAVAAGGLGAGAVFVWLILRVIDVLRSHWPWILGTFIGAVVLLGIGATAVSLRAGARKIREQRLREIAHLAKVDTMTGSEFEHLVAELLRRDGYRSVGVVGRTGDRGVDVIARSQDGRRIAVQCKRQSRPVGADRVRNLIGAVHSSYAGHVGVLVTSNTFTGPARSESQDRLVLVGRDRLAEWMDGEALGL
jgi:restriction system protein